MPHLAEQILVGLLVLAAVAFLAWKLTASFRNKDANCCGGRCGCATKPSKRPSKGRPA